MASTAVTRHMRRIATRTPESSPSSSSERCSPGEQQRPLDPVRHHLPALPGTLADADADADAVAVAPATTAGAVTSS
ncbi:hypothetical protein [Streptomyces parvus]|uniref:hypothetical protein n=1 Tax=Streptomyces parvus TaxID=66428 RepID=UPI003F4D8879